MCGRTALTATSEDLRDALGLDEAPDLAPRYNTAPSQPVAVMRVPGKLELLQWGLVPFWARDRKIGHKLSLARIEGVLTAPAFRHAIRQRRCLVVVTGFYEWRRETKSVSTPFLISRRDRKLFALAALWERWVSKDGEIVESCAILTQPARPPIDAIHDRMPLVLDRGDWERWLDPELTDVQPLLQWRRSEAALVAWPVDPRVNDPRHDAPTCQVPTQPAQGRLFASLEAGRPEESSSTAPPSLS